MKEEIRMRSQDGKGLLQDQDVFLLHISGALPKRFDGQMGDTSDAQTSGHIPIYKHSLNDPSASPQTTESLPGLEKHWMSVRPKHFDGQIGKTPNIQTSGRLPIYKHSLNDPSASPQTTESSPSLEKHWMSVRPKRFDGQTGKIPTVQTTGHIPIYAHSLNDPSASPQTTESSPSLEKHWMSARQQQIYISLVFFAVGFSAITALAIAIIGWLPLDIAAYIFVWPSVIIWLAVGILYPDYGKLALKGFVIGILACLFYDAMRFAAIELGLWGDFIPRIGMWLLHTDKPDWLIGYVWRYVGDGGFMSTAFVVGYFSLKPKLDVRIAALSFGLAIWVCLVGTILLAPHGVDMLFPLTPVTLGLSLLGHIIYGLSIGFLYHVFIPKNVGIRQIATSLSEPLLAPKQKLSAGQSYLNLETGFTSQFVKPGFIDIRHKEGIKN
jgi:hypothetical protein